MLKFNTSETGALFVDGKLCRNYIIFKKLGSEECAQSYIIRELEHL